MSQAPRFLPDNACGAERFIGGGVATCERPRLHLGQHRSIRFAWSGRSITGQNGGPPRRWIGRADLHERFQAIVKRAVEKVDAELEPARGPKREPMTLAEQKRIHHRITFPGRPPKNARLDGDED